MFMWKKQTKQLNQNIRKKDKQGSIFNVKTAYRCNHDTWYEMDKGGWYPIR